MKESFALKFLYDTIPGRICLKILTNPAISKIAGFVLDSGISTILIKPFMRTYDISLDGIKIPEKGFSSFNEFFCRERLNPSVDMNKSHLISPCDGFLSTYKIDKNSCFKIKHTKFSVEDLLRDKKLAKEFQGGVALVFRLTPANYHRYIFIDDGKVLKHKKIRGVLHTVRPIALAKFPVFVQNSREVTIEQTENFGKIAQIEIGALLVGRITNKKAEKRVKRGQEKGYFEFGGSTIVLLLSKKYAKYYKDSDAEIPVILGETIEKV